MPGTLYVVATPIGNLEDITLRALRVLREVQVIAAEDTRRTAKLLSHYSIQTPTTSLHEHNEGVKAGRLVERLLGGEDVALVSDAGTPLVSDPGAHLVSESRKAGIDVVAVPGPSAVMTLLAASGLRAERFLFLGFPPRRASDLERWVKTYFTPPHLTAVFYEAPHRIRTTLKRMQDSLGDRPIIVGRELTKHFEELVEGPISRHLAALAEPRGEFSVAVPSCETAITSAENVSDSALVDEIGLLTNSRHLSTREAAKEIAQRHGLTANEVYRRTRLKSD